MQAVDQRQRASQGEERPRCTQGPEIEHAPHLMDHMISSIPTNHVP